MAILPHEIVVTVERRQVAITKGDGTERLGFFHKWSKYAGEDCVIVENIEGKIEQLSPYSIRFLPVGDGVLPEELEKIYKDNGIIKAVASCFMRKTEREPSNENRCVICFETIPEGRQICHKCEVKEGAE